MVVHWRASLFLLVLAIIVCVSPLSLAREISFKEAYELTMEHSPDIEAARLSVEGALSKRDQALGKLLPQASIFGQWSKNRLTYESESFLYSDADYPGQRYGLNVQQALLAVSDGLELNRQNLLVRLSEDEETVVEADLFEQLVAAYLDILMSDSEVAVLKEELSAVRTQLRESRALYEKNFLSVTQVLETESREATLASELIMAEGKAAVSREALVRFTGLQGGEPLKVRENVALLGRFSSPEAAANTALSADPAIAAAKTTVSAAEKALLREKSRWLPEVTVNYNFQHSDVGFDNLSSPPRDTSTLAVNFQYPIFEGGAKFARVRGASAEYGSALNSLRAQELDTQARARSAWLVFDAASERVVSARQAVISFDVNVSATQKAIKAGTARHTDALLALAQRARAERDLIEARFFYVRAWVEMELAVGVSPSVLAETLSSAMHSR